MTQRQLLAVALVAWAGYLSVAVLTANATVLPIEHGARTAIAVARQPALDGPMRAVSLLGEEWGLVGTLTVVALFVVIAVQGYRSAIRAPDTFSGLVACGITTWLVVQACVNMMVVTALLPVTGIPLPFISAGGSALTINLAAVGILLSISRETSQTGSLFDAVFGVGRRDRRARVPRAGRRASAPRRAKRR